MPSFDRGSLSEEGYLTRVIAALCRNNGGEIRVKGELVDIAQQSPTRVVKYWDSATQEIVFLCPPANSFTEVFHANTVAQPTKDREIRQPAPPEDAVQVTRTTNTLDDSARLDKIDLELRRRKTLSAVAAEIRRQGGSVK
jgi:hypothetical protein